MTLAERFHQLNLTRQMIRVIRADAMQFNQQVPGDNLRLRVLHAVDYAMSHSQDRVKTNLLFKPINQEIYRGFMIGGGEVETSFGLSIRVMKRQVRSAQTDAVNLSTQAPLQRFVRFIQRKLYAR